MLFLDLLEVMKLLLLILQSSRWRDSNSEVKSKLNRYYYSVDEQGSKVFITDKNQSVKNEYCYDAFGNVLESTWRSP